MQQALKTMRSQKSEIDSLQFQLTQSAQKVRSSVERELQETFQSVKNERDQYRDMSASLELSAKDGSLKLAMMSEELRQQKEELQLAYTQSEELKLELHKKNDMIIQETDKVAILERQLDTRFHRCNDLERELNYIRRKLEEQAQSRKVVATQTVPECDTAEEDNQIACLQDKLAVTERRMKDALDQLSRTAKERDALRGQLNDVTESSSAMQLKLDKNSAIISSLETDLKQSAHEIARLEMTVSEKEKRNQMAEHAADEMKNEITSLTAENAVFKNQQSHEDKLNSLLSSLEQKNSELMSQVSSLTKELQTMQGIGREVSQQRDNEVIQLELDAEQQLNQQQHRGEMKLAGTDVGTQKEESGAADTAKDGSLGRLKKQYETELQSSVNRQSELTSQVDSLKRELRAVEVSYQQIVSELEEKVAHLTAKLSSAERRAYRLGQKRTSSNSQSDERDAQTCDDRLDKPFNILSLMEMPVGNEPTSDAAVAVKMIPSSDTAGDLLDPRQQTAGENHQLITALQSRVGELERELEKSKCRKVVNVQDETVVSNECVCCKIQ